MVSDWIFDHNLKAFVDILSELAGCSFDGGDWDAIESGLADTNARTDRWYEHPLTGESMVDLALAVEPGSSVVRVRIQADPDVETKAEMAVWIAQSYNISMRCGRA